MHKWREQVDDWKRLLQSTLTWSDDAQEETSQDPYLRLKLAETKALAIAEALAPKHKRQSNDVSRAIV